MKKIIYSRNISIPDEEFVKNILEIDKSVYPSNMQGTMCSVLGRYHANKDEYILLTNDADEIVGYLCCFPVKESFYNEIIKSNHAFDDNITSDKIVEYTRGQPHYLFLISIAVKPDSRDGAAKMLAQAFENFIKDKRKNGYNIIQAVSYAMTNKGAAFLEKSSFSFKKNCGRACLYVRNFDDNDVYVFFSMTGNLPKPIPTCQISKELEMLSKEMDKTGEYECAGGIYSVIKRESIGTHTIGICPDIYSDSEDNFVTYIAADILLVTHIHSPFVLIILLFRDVCFDITMLLDNLSTEQLRIRHENGEEFLLDYFSRKYNCRTTGAAKTLLCTAQKPQDEILSIFGGEFYNSSTLAGSAITDKDGNERTYKIRPEVFQQECDENIALYNWYDCYASERAIIYVLPSRRGSSFIDSLQYETAMVYIIELLMFRSGAIKNANKQVVTCLSGTQTLTLKNIEELYNSLGKTLELWEKQSFKYAAVQKLYNNIAKRFELDTEEKDFYRKLEQVEHVVELRRSQKNEKDSAAINKILISLAGTQVVLIVTQIILALIEIIELPVWMWSVLLTLCILVMGGIPLFIIMRGKRKKHE
ncbi:MAG: hypothetical protein LBD59_04700 [Prevotellaceae bacterium]|jgi:hypothetical protein|nr:hypothetical protein [Prevotellaceae bacterium]